MKAVTFSAKLPAYVRTKLMGKINKKFLLDAHRQSQLRRIDAVWCGAYI